MSERIPQLTHDQKLEIIWELRKEFQRILGDDVNPHIFDQLELACWRTLGNSKPRPSLRDQLHPTGAGL